MSKIEIKGDSREEEVFLSLVTIAHCILFVYSILQHLRCPSCDLPIKRERDISAEAKAISTSQFEDVDGDDDNEGLDEEDFCSSGPDEGFSEVARGWEDSVSAPSSLEEMKKEYDLKHRRREEVSAKMGEKMLAGWTMLAQTCTNPACAGTPLMQSRSRGPEPQTVLCVSCSCESALDQGRRDTASASRNPNPIKLAQSSTGPAR